MEWRDALKKGRALRFVAATEPQSSTAVEPRGVLGMSPDGERVLVQTLDDVRACDADLAEWKVLRRGQQTVAACFAGALVIVASRQRRLAAVDSRGKSVWSRTTPAELGEIRHLRANASGEVVVAHEHGCLTWVDPETGTERRRMMLEKRSGTLREFDGETGNADGPEYEAVMHEKIVEIDPSGRYALTWLPKLYVGAHHPGDVRLWDVESESCVSLAENVLDPGGAALGNGARWGVAFSVWAAIDLWDLAGRKRVGFRPVGESVGTTLWGPTAAISPDGRHWVSAVEKEICLWEMSAESPIERIAMPSYPSIERALAFSPDGASLYFCLGGCAVRVAVDPDAAR